MRLKRFYFLTISLFICFFAGAQSVSEVVSFADQQFTEGNYAIAAREYNRAFFFGYDRVDIVSLQIGHCYNEMSDYEMSASFYDRAFKYSQNDSIKNEATLGKAFCMLLQKKNLPAIEELLYINDRASNEQLAQMHYLKGIAFYNLKDDSLAYEQFSSAIDLSMKSDSLQSLLNEEFSRVYSYQKRYSPMRSYIMSGFFPGSGQIAVGAYKDGINSMALIAGLAYIAMRIMANYSFLDAAITLLPWVQRYYLGGMDKAKALAETKIGNKRYQSYLKILELTSPESYR